MGTQQLVIDNLRLAAGIASNIAKRLPSQLDLQDIHQDARLGLIYAAAQYDAGRNSSFGSYARRRIGRAVLDGLRQADHLSRRARTRIKAEGAEPPIALLSLAVPDGIPGVVLAPDQYAARAEHQRILAAAINTLPARLRIVLHTYYDGGKTMHEIGARLGVNECRVSQIHARALRLLRRHFEQFGFTSYAAFARAPEARQ
jgi:RNA polymerase sigma factor for flagellar operon FliA